MRKDLDFYINAFTHLHRDSKNGGAPHQPILLLSVIHEYETGGITNNKIEVTPELTHTFSTIWNRYVRTNHDPRFALPFFHLSNTKGGWWKLIPNPGCEIWIQMPGSMRSFSNLSAAVAYAEIDPELSFLLVQHESRNQLKKALLECYFPSLLNLEIDDDNYLDSLKKEIFEEPCIDYKANLTKLKKTFKSESYEIEVFNRTSIFRREVIRVYDETCCVSNLKLTSIDGLNMVDACHIKPFAKTGNNSLTNGIALCPNLHRAFDRGMIAVNDNFEVVVSERFTESAESVYSIKQLAGKPILLPTEPRYRPLAENFAWHRKHTFKL